MNLDLGRGGIFSACDAFCDTTFMNLYISVG